MTRFLHSSGMVPLATALGLLALPLAALAQEGGFDPPPGPRPEPPPTLTVTGHGTVGARPDRCIVRLGVEAQADTAAAAQDEVNTAMQKVLPQIRKLGVAQSGIRTEDIRLSPVYSRQKPGEESEPPRIVGYRASNTIQVEVTDLTRIGKVIDAGTSEGANRVEGVSFTLKNDLEYRSEALRTAAQKAKTEAETLATALGLQLGPIIKVDQVAVNVPRPAFYAGMATAKFMAAPTPVEPGELTIDAAVTVTYRIGPEGAKR